MSEPAATYDPALDYRRGRRPEGSPPGFAASVAPWYALLGGAIAWALHFVVTYAIAEVACRSDRLDVVLLGLPAPHLFAYAATLLAGATAIGAAVVAYGLAPNGVRADPVDAAGEHEALGRLRFIAYAGVIINGLFLVATIAGGLPYFFLRACVAP
jgi:hypothetical protein